MTADALQKKQTKKSDLLSPLSMLTETFRLPRHNRDSIDVSTGKKAFFATDKCFLVFSSNKKNIKTLVKLLEKK